VQLKLLAALALMAASLGAALAAGPGSGARENYLKLCAWDCAWYGSIASSGYHSVIPPVAQNPALSNVAFFPGYPYAARAIYRGLGLRDARIPLLVVAQACCLAFWLAFFGLLGRWRVRPWGQAVAAGLVFAHPAAFYLVAGYSESMFLASMLLFMYWTDAAIEGSGGDRQRGYAAAAGFVMTATRIVGLPVAIYPLLRHAALGSRADARSRRDALAISVLASLGALLFLVYCQGAFGSYRLYMETQRIGWGIVPDYRSLVHWSSFQYARPYEKVATLASGLGFAAYGLLELTWWARGRGREVAARLPYFVCAGLIFYITLSGLESLWFRSMIRYTLPWWVLGVLCGARMGVPPAGRPEPTGWRAAACALLAALAAAFYFWQFPYLVDFLNGGWFA
jgi:hypothetical protein